MKHINIVFKIILPLLLGLFLIAVVSIYANFFLLQKQISKKSNETFDSISILLDTIIQQDTDLMLGLIEQLEKDEKIITLFKSKKREEQQLYWMNESVKNLLLKDFYNTNGIQSEIEKITQQLKKEQLTSHQAASKIITYYKNEKGNI